MFPSQCEVRVETGDYLGTIKSKVQIAKLHLGVQQTVNGAMLNYIYDVESFHTDVCYQSSRSLLNELKDIFLRIIGRVNIHMTEFYDLYANIRIFFFSYLRLLS